MDPAGIGRSDAEAVETQSATSEEPVEVWRPPAFNILPVDLKQESAFRERLPTEELTMSPTRLQQALTAMISESSLSFGKNLGHGCFGHVLEGELNGRAVAVKKLNSTMEPYR